MQHQGNQSSLSANMVHKKSSPFTQHQQEFENMKRQLQVSKGISGIDQNNYGHSPVIYRGPNPGKGPVKAVVLDSLLTSSQQLHL